MCAGMNVIDVPGTLVRTQAVWGATHDWLAAPPLRRHRPALRRRPCGAVEATDCLAYGPTIRPTPEVKRCPW
ncbi:hypothetical protein SLITK23_57370 [Streptomyces lividans]|nr:hypothetical protein SLITK23_57370 [Streptomyces lividans]